MKKFISLVVALAMILSICPVLNAFAAVEETVVFDAAEIDTATHGDIQLADYGWSANEGGALFSSQWSTGGAWNVAPWGVAGLMFFRTGARANGTDETKVATFDDGAITAGSDKIVIEYTYATQEASDLYQRWHFLDVDGKEFATVYTDAGSATSGGVQNAGMDIGGVNGTAYALVSHDRSKVLGMRGVPFRIEAVKAADGTYTVTYSYDSDKNGEFEVITTETIDSINGFGSISANIPQWNNQYAAMALQGLKISANVDSEKVVKVTVKTVLSDGTPSGVDDKEVLATVGESFTYVPQSTAPIKIGDDIYTYSEKDSTLTITPKAGSDNVITIMYNKFDGAGITGSVIADGATCWFADPRTLTVKGDGVNYTYIGYIDNVGNVRATQYDNLTGDYEEVLVRSNLQPDDHNNPTFLELPDHKIMIFYSRHTDEPCFYYRVSKEAYDITTFGEEHRLATEKNTTYPNPVILESDPDHIYLTWRGVEWHPTIAQLEMPSKDNGFTTKFTWGPRQIVQSTLGSNIRPYAKYASNGKDKIWLTYTGTHPDNVGTNPIYCNYISIPELKLYDMKGNELSDLKSSNVYTVSGNETDPNYVVDRTANYRDWVWEIALDERVEGENKVEFPVIAMVKIDGSKKVHNYYYATYTGSGWNIFDLPDPSFNTFFHQTPATENCYSGGMSIDKADPHIVYASIPVDGAFGRIWEIVKWTLNDSYTDLADEEFITKDSMKDNARPYVSNGSEEGDLRLTWFNGDYYYWIHSNQHGGLGYPVQMMTTTELKELPVVNKFDGVDEEIYGVGDGVTATAPITAGKEFTISLELLQSDMAAEGTLLKSGNLKIDLEKQTVDNTHNYAAVAPKLTVGSVVEKSQNLFSDSAWYFSLGGTGGTKGQSSLGWINYTITYDGSELVTYVNGLIDATMQNVNVSLGDTVTLGGEGMITNLRSADVAFTQAEVRAAAEEFDEDSVDTINGLSIPSETVTDLVLPTKTADGKTVTWTVDGDGVMDATGAVTRDGEDHVVTLTASAGDSTKVFTVTVLAKVDVMDENLMFYYDFNNVDGNIVPDVSGNGLDAEVKGSKANFDNGKLDLTANTADGWDTNGYLNVPHDFLKGVRSYTVVQKISGGTDRQDPRLYDFGMNSGNSMFTRLNTRDGNRYQAGVKYAGGTTLMVQGGAYLSGEYWLVTSYNAATKTTTVYTVDSDNNIVTQATGTNVTYQAYQIAGATDRNLIGRGQWYTDTANRGNNQDFNGTIDNFMFFNTALSEDEIKEVTATIPAPIVSLGWDDEAEDFTIDFTYSGDSVKVYKNGDKENPVVGELNGESGVAFSTADTNASYQAVGVTDEVESKATAVVSVYSLVAQAVADFAAKNADTVIKEDQLVKAMEVLNNGGIYLTNRKLTAEAELLMTLTDNDDTITIDLKAEVYNAGVRFADTIKYASDKESDIKSGVTVSNDGKTITIGDAMALEAVIYLEDVEFVLEVEEAAADETVAGELDFIEEV
ncbi:MAG: BNR-4 repeat-containing protein [Oscillospiraceae bacterium]|nr:BNR-4 repeat-containing protein [Oscillospiraceae bacterium]